LFISHSLLHSSFLPVAFIKKRSIIKSAGELVFIKKTSMRLPSGYNLHPVRQESAVAATSNLVKPAIVKPAERPVSPVNGPKTALPPGKSPARLIQEIKDSANAGIDKIRMRSNWRRADKVGDIYLDAARNLRRASAQYAGPEKTQLERHAVHYVTSARSFYHEARFSASEAMNTHPDPRAQSDRQNGIDKIEEKLGKMHSEFSTLIELHKNHQTLFD
jgi:hypothetical protein